MKQKHNIEAQFEKAGLACKVLEDPIRAIDSDIFQMDIQRGFEGNKRKEFFRLYKGHPDNIVAVQNIDKKIKQLVLLVKEPARTFESAQPMPGVLVKEIRPLPEKERLAQARAWAKTQNPRAKVVRVEVTKYGGRIFLEQKTSNRVRYYLCGVDERQLFIAQLLGHVTTVAEAHQSLKGNNVSFAEGRAEGKTIRQGEWFFINATQTELEEIEQALERNKLSIFKKSDIGRLTGMRRGGKPHVAQEAVVVGGTILQHGFPARERPDVFVRGRVAHPDHASVNFPQWRKVLKNNESMGDSQRGADGVYWID